MESIDNDVPTTKSLPSLRPAAVPVLCEVRSMVAWWLASGLQIQQYTTSRFPYRRVVDPQL